MLLAGLALAVGLTGLGDVDLEEPELLASALIHVSNFHHICLVVANASLLCPELRSQLILCPKFPNCFEVNGGSWHGLSVCLNGVSSLLIGICFPPTPLAKPNANPVRSPTSSIPSPHPKTPANPRTSKQFKARYLTSLLQENVVPLGFGIAKNNPGSAPPEKWTDPKKKKKKLDKNWTWRILTILNQLVVNSGVVRARLVVGVVVIGCPGEETALARWWLLRPS